MKENPATKKQRVELMLQDEVEDNPNAEEYIKEIFEKISKTEEGEKIVNTITNSKNVVNNSNISAGGNIQIGDRNVIQTEQQIFDNKFNDLYKSYDKFIENNKTGLLKFWKCSKNSPIDVLLKFFKENFEKPKSENIRKFISKVNQIFDLVNQSDTKDKDFYYTQIVDITDDDLLFIFYCYLNQNDKNNLLEYDLLNRFSEYKLTKTRTVKIYRR
ncbi:MAG: hypothetical protein AB8G11_12415 [Saprospiraceae bacterium]